MFDFLMSVFSAAGNAVGFIARFGSMTWGEFMDVLNLGMPVTYTNLYTGVSQTVPGLNMFFNAISDSLPAWINSILTVLGYAFVFPSQWIAQFFMSLAPGGRDMPLLVGLVLFVLGFFIIIKLYAGILKAFRALATLGG